jgi:hypothetical protein
MTKLTKYTSYKSLKLSGQSGDVKLSKKVVLISELEDFLNLLQHTLAKNKKLKINKVE